MKGGENHIQHTYFDHLCLFQMITKMKIHHTDIVHTKHNKIQSNTVTLFFLFLFFIFIVYGVFDTFPLCSSCVWRGRALVIRTRPFWAEPKSTTCNKSLFSFFNVTQLNAIADFFDKYYGCYLEFRRVSSNRARIDCRGAAGRDEMEIRRLRESLEYCELERNRE